MNKKLNNAYKTIGEVAELLNLKNGKNGKLNTYILRFWEKEFKQIKPKILYGNRRYYSDKDISILKKLKPTLVYFLKTSSNIFLTIEESNELNKPCVIFDYFDYHDIWHILSAT